MDKAFRLGAVLLSVEALLEVEDVLLREKFERYQAIEVRRRYLDFLSEAANIISVSTKVTACRDTKDNKFLELAVDGRADIIISGDNDLLVLHPFRGIPIITPMDYLAL